VRLRTLILFITLFSITALTSSAIAYLPTSTPYSIFNIGLYGFSNAVSETTQVYSVEDIAKLSRNTTLITLTIDLDEADVLKSYVLNGGTLIILYDINKADRYVDELLDGISIENVTIVDNTYHVESGDTPFAWVAIDQNIWRIALYRPSPIRIESSEWIPIALSSPFSFKDMDSNGVKDASEVEDRYVVGACRGLGEGRVCIFTSPSLISNRLLNHNIGFLRSFGEELFLYIDPDDLPLVDRLRLMVYRGFSRTGFVLLLASLSIVLGMYFRSIRPTKIYLLVLALSSLCLLAEVIMVGGWEAFALIALAFLSMYLKRGSLSLTSLASILMYLGHVPQFLLLSIPLYILYPLTLTAVERKPPSDILGFSTETSLRIVGVFAVASMMYPMSIASLATFLLSIAVTALTWYAKLRGVKVKILQNFEVVLGRGAGFPIVLENPMRVRVFGRLGSSGVVAEFSEGINVLNIPYSSRRLGIVVERVEVVIEDAKGLASRKHVASVAINTVPSVSALLQEVSTWLGEFVEYVGRVVERKLVEAGLLPVPGKGRGTSMGRGAGLGSRGTVQRVLQKAVVVLEEEGLAKSRRGIYYGVRLYVSGDELRDIHWKKTLSRGQLVAKMYTSSYEGGGSGGVTGGAALIADLEASNEYELDRLAYELVSYLAYGARYTPEMKTAVYLTLPNAATLVLVGDFRTVLAGVVSLFRKGLIRVDTDYLSQGASLSMDEMKRVVEESEKNRLLKAMLLANSSYIHDVVETLRNVGIDPPSAYILIHGSTTSFKHSYLDYILSSLEYRRLVRKGGYLWRAEHSVAHGLQG